MTAERPHAGGGSRVARSAVLAGRWSIAHAAIKVEEYAFDYLLYPFMLYRGGPYLLDLLWHVEAADRTSIAGYWLGFAILLLLSLCLNLLYICLYDASRTDWFGFVAIGGLRLRLGGSSRHGRLARFLLRWLAFLYLSVWHSPLFGTLFMREQGERFVMTKRDWGIFFGALAVANLGWAGIVSGAVLIARFLL